MTAQFRTGTWFGRRNTVGMKCAHATVCRSFSRTRSQFFFRREKPSWRFRKMTVVLFQETNIEVLCSPLGLACRRWKGKEKRHQVSCGLATCQVLLIELFVQLTQGMISDYSYVVSFCFAYLVNGCGSLSCLSAWFRKQSAKVTAASPVTPPQLKIPIVTLGKFTSASRSRAAACCSSAAVFV